MGAVAGILSTSNSNPEPDYTISFYKDQYIREAYEFSDIFISFATWVDKVDVNLLINRE